MDIIVPEGSIYFWMYTQGLKHIPFDDIISACLRSGKIIRKKDEENYWSGYYNSDLYRRDESGKIVSSILSINDRFPRSSMTCFEMEWDEYPDHPYSGQPEIPNRWVPCTSDGKPLIKWGEGCLLRSEAEAYRNYGSIAENLKGCQHIVIDFDGDHDPKHLDIELASYANRLAERNHALMKPKVVSEYSGYEGMRLADDMHLKPVSLHITFAVDKVIPTMHFSKAHIDIIGNQKNSIRYYKNKVWNGIQAQPMDDYMWKSLMSYIRSKEGK